MRSTYIRPAASCPAVALLYSICPRQPDPFPSPSPASAFPPHTLPPSLTSRRPQLSIPSVLDHGIIARLPRVLNPRAFPDTGTLSSVDILAASYPITPANHIAAD
ncbi:hypothetical protein B0T25DRAFT_515509 [Lasiosphaeria hispida]|uniref:Uncharacterized protein n=1 Tax=Lasiosphaeria hispida TaxID=260671 RepID=A0AAJ0MIB6_9PEZI|nr:hypothetical protein B0T25DRAFT_515509 [Lasiosphaeria hispida]